MSTTFPPQEPGRHGIAELLALVGSVRRLAYDRSLTPDDAMRRIRDTFGEYDGIFTDPLRRILTLQTAAGCRFPDRRELSADSDDHETGAPAPLV